MVGPPVVGAVRGEGIALASLGTVEVFLAFHALQNVHTVGKGRGPWSADETRARLYISVYLGIYEGI